MATQLKTITAPPSEGFLARVDSRKVNVGIIGLGYVGLPLALLFSGERFNVTGFDVDQRKVDSLEAGQTYIYSIAPFSIEHARHHGFRPTSDMSCIASMDAVIICVPTPLNEHQEPDLKYIVSTAEAIAPHVNPGQLIVLESTTYPGTTEDVLVPIIERSGLKASRGDVVGPNEFMLAFSPERENPGNDSISRHDIPKVVGGLGPAATEAACALYNTLFKTVVPVSTPAAAEMTKLLENIYRCVNIALVNEMKLICMRMGIDIWEVIEAAKTKPFGFQAFYPGPGLGGHCIPVDPFYLTWRAKEFDFNTRFIELAGEINVSMPYHVVDCVGRALNTQDKPLKGARVLVLGVAYKKDVDDLRESPALTIIELLRDRDARVDYHDPYLPHVGRGRHYDLQMNSVPLDGLGKYDCALIVTDHSNVDYARVVEQSNLVVDTRNATHGIHSPKIVRC